MDKKFENVYSQLNESRLNESTKLSLDFPFGVKVDDYHNLDAIQNLLSQLLNKKVYSTEAETINGEYSGVFHLEKNYKGDLTPQKSWPFISL